MKADVHFSSRMLTLSGGLMTGTDISSRWERPLRPYADALPKTA